MIVLPHSYLYQVSTYFEYYALRKVIGLATYHCAMTSNGGMCHSFTHAQLRTRQAMAYPTSIMPA